MPLIHILRPDGTEADVDERDLAKTVGVSTDGSLWVEYREPGSSVVVHRSAQTTLTGLGGGAVAANFTGA